MAKGSQAKDAAIKRPSHIGIVKNDSYLAPFEDAIRGRHDHALWKLAQLTRDGKQTLSDFSNGYQYYGLHKSPKGWVFREWAPNATRIFLVGDCNDWQENPEFELKRIEDSGNWELTLPLKALKHGQLYKLHVYHKDLFCASLGSSKALSIQERNFQAPTRSPTHLRVPHRNGARCRESRDLQ